MKNYSYFVILFLLIGFSAQAQTYYGEKINARKAVKAEKISAEMENQNEASVKVKGTILQTCRKKGCWMTVDMGNDQKLLVRFKDYGFFVPTEGVDGKETIVEGVLKKEVIDVATLRHYAEDAGKSKEEIEAITEPEEKYTFEAVGVIIK